MTKGDVSLVFTFALCLLPLAFCLPSWAVAVLKWRAQMPQRRACVSRPRLQKDAKTERRSRRARWHGRCDRRRSSVEKVLPRGDARCRRALRKRHRKTDHFPLKENQKTMKKLVLACALVMSVLGGSVVFAQNANNTAPAAPSMGRHHRRHHGMRHHRRHHGHRRARGGNTNT